MQSNKWTLNKNDWKAQGRAALKWFAPVILLYVAAILGVIQQEGHVFSWSDLIPTTFTVGSIVTWALMQVQGLFLRLSEGK